MRLRASHVYGIYADKIKFKDEIHIQKIVDGIFSNMAED
jgi:hypothetical protein